MKKKAVHRKHVTLRLDPEILKALDDRVALLQELLDPNIDRTKFIEHAIISMLDQPKYWGLGRR